MKRVLCPCGAEFKTHNDDELVQIVNIHVQTSHDRSAISPDEVMQMATDA